MLRLTLVRYVVAYWPCYFQTEKFVSKHCRMNIPNKKDQLNLYTFNLCFSFCWNKKEVEPRKEKDKKRERERGGEREKQEDKRERRLKKGSIEERGGEGGR